MWTSPHDSVKCNIRHTKCKTVCYSSARLPRISLYCSFLAPQFESSAAATAAASANNIHLYSPDCETHKKNVPSVSTAALVTHLDELSDEPRGIIQDHQLAVWKTRQTGEQLLRGLKITQQCRSTRINLLYLFWIISNFLTYTDKLALS